MGRWTSVSIGKLKDFGGGYMHPKYAEALSEFGVIRHLRNSDGWILVSAIDGWSYYDGRGCYPLFSCAKWKHIRDDMEELGRDLVSIVFVADPFGEYSEDDLNGYCPDLCRPYKDHYVAELSCWSKAICGHHARNIRKSSAFVDVEQ